MITCETRTQRTQVLHLENHHLNFVLFSDASTEITVKDSGMVWKQGPVAYQDEGDFDQNLGWYRGKRASYTNYAARFKVQREGEVVRVDMFDDFGAFRGTFRCSYQLRDAFIEVKVIQIHDGLPSLVFPTPIYTDALLLPVKQGKILRGVDNKMKFERSFLRNPILNSRWFGGLRGDDEQHGWVTILAEGYEDGGVLHSGPMASPVWMKSLDTWNTRRTLLIGFSDQGYVGIAKRFRKWAQERGLWGVSLREKLAANPRLGAMIGGRKIRLHNFVQRRADLREDVLLEPDPDAVGEEIMLSFAEARALADEIKAAGMTKGVFKYGGWGQGGYDYQHPDVWPPDERLGTLEDFRAMLHEEGDFISCLHDNYYDLYKQSSCFPEGACHDRRGKPMRVGIWAGGQAYPANTRMMYPYASKVAEHIAEYGCGNHYFDTFSFLTQSFKEGNTLTRREDMEWKQRIFEYSNAQGMLTGSEDGNDFYVAHSHWSPKGKWTVEEDELPLWPLIFNDAHLGMRAVYFGRKGQRSSPQEFRKKCLENLVLGFAPTFVLGNAEDFRAAKSDFQNSFYVDRWHEKIALEEMIDHQVLDDQHKVHRVVYANGAAMTVNLGETAFEVDGQPLEGMDFREEG